MLTALFHYLRRPVPQPGTGNEAFISDLQLPFDYAGGRGTLVQRSIDAQSPGFLVENPGGTYSTISAGDPVTGAFITGPLLYPARKDAITTG